MHTRTIERAYELAATGECANVTDLKKRLKAEGCVSVEAHISGMAIITALRNLCAAADRTPRGSCTV